MFVIKKRKRSRFIYAIIGLSLLMFINDFQNPLSVSIKLWKDEFHDPLCPNIKSNDFKEVKNIENYKIAMVIPVSSTSDYKLALTTLECYANHFGYQFVLLNITTNERNENCQQSDVFFKRHCFVVNFMESNIGKIDYVLFLDADIGVVNPCHTLQEYIDDDPNVEITFYDRYFDYEIAAGSYIAKNSEYARKFLKSWADFKLPKSFFGTDNGAIHQIFMDHHFNDTESQKQCYKYMKKSVNLYKLFKYEACVRNALGNHTYFVNGRIKLIRKGIWCWIRDGWLTKTAFAPRDFMFHDWKKQKLRGEWLWPFKDKIFNINKCNYADSFSSWTPKKEFLKSNDEIRQLLDLIASEVHDNYTQILKEMKLIK